jgi:hypothetical protein
VVIYYQITIYRCVITQKSAVLNLRVCFIIQVYPTFPCVRKLTEPLQAVSAYTQHHTHQHTGILLVS